MCLPKNIDSTDITAAATETAPSTDSTDSSSIDSTGAVDRLSRCRRCGSAVSIFREIDSMLSRFYLLNPELSKLKAIQQFYGPVDFLCDFPLEIRRRSKALKQWSNVTQEGKSQQISLVIFCRKSAVVRKHINNSQHTRRKIMADFLGDLFVDQSYVNQSYISVMTWYYVIDKNTTCDVHVMYDHAKIFSLMWQASFSSVFFDVKLTKKPIKHINLWKKKKPNWNCVMESGEASFQVMTPNTRY